MNNKIFIRCFVCHTLKGCDMNNDVQACEERGCDTAQRHECIREMRQKDCSITTVHPCAICGYKRTKKMNCFSSDE